MKPVFTIDENGKRTLSKGMCILKTKINVQGVELVTYHRDLLGKSLIVHYFDYFKCRYIFYL